LLREERWRCLQPRVRGGRSVVWDMQQPDWGDVISVTTDKQVCLKPGVLSGGSTRAASWHRAKLGGREAETGQDERAPPSRWLRGGLGEESGAQASPSRRPEVTISTSHIARNDPRRGSCRVAAGITCCTRHASGDDQAADHANPGAHRHAHTTVVAALVAATIRGHPVAINGAQGPIELLYAPWPRR
jgi:hypothetical protein